jgi:hypothetical protein
MASSLSLWERLGRGELLCHLLVLPYAVVCRRTLPRAGVVSPLETWRRCGVALAIISPCPTGTAPRRL